MPRTGERVIRVGHGLRCGKPLAPAADRSMAEPEDEITIVLADDHAVVRAELVRYALDHGLLTD
jgi:hypothetical protein